MECFYFILLCCIIEANFYRGNRIRKKNHNHTIQTVLNIGIALGVNAEDIEDILQKSKEKEEED